jgi:hypothetical protein
MTPGKRWIAVAVILALPFATEAICRAALFLKQRSSAPPGPVFSLIGVGESTMNGFPFEPYINIPVVVAKMFDGKILDRDIIVQNLARDGHPIYSQYSMLAQAIAYRDRQTPGAVIIYAGHNEGDLRGGGAAWGPGFFERLARHSFVIRALRLQLVTMRVIRRPRDIRAYEYFLRRTIETAREAGLLPVLATVAGNASGVEPNLETSDGRAVEEAMAVVEAQRKHGDCASIESRCAKEAEADTDLAPLLCYQAGKCRQAAGETARADELYQTAVDLDPRTVFGRATRAQNAIVRKLGAEYRIPVVDSVTLLAPSGVLGNDMFGDGQHPNLGGILVIARAYADAIAGVFATKAPRRSLTAQEAMAEFGFTPRLQARAHVLSGSWLIASAAHHPWPYDRLSLAETHLRNAVAIAPDDFTAWFDMAVTMAARGGFLREPDVLEKLGEWSVFYRPVACVPDEAVAPMVDRFRSLGVDEEVLAKILENRGNACAGDGLGRQ